jgi:hypothetical protein
MVIIIVEYKLGSWPWSFLLLQNRQNNRAHIVIDGRRRRTADLEDAWDKAVGDMNLL